ncbi:MAG TPA: IclR family transcriptional regulator [Spirochaetales bacterium]|nr:IclR family transcriptional regulator [Spirochaetales bacterium]HRY56421.1 IclR family transcriptional regulator [Spirochaetia bacterium]HRZ64247.1 IclR family transcriptional regulator [Spirochaetia bacterium]
MKKSDTSIIHSLDKGLFLLETVEQAAQPVSLQELWETLKWDKATIYRLLVTLEKRGYIHRDPKDRRYSLGMKIYALYDSMIRSLDLQQITKTYLDLLAKKTGQSAHLAVAVGNRIVFIDRSVGSEVLSVNTQIGASEPLHCTALGKAFLAYSEPEKRDELLAGPLEKFTAKTISNKRDIPKEMAVIKARGYAVDDEEYTEGILCVASPILNSQGQPIAMMGISGLKNRMSAERVAEYGSLISKNACEVSRKFGYGKG